MYWEIRPPRTKRFAKAGTLHPKIPVCIESVNTSLPLTKQWEVDLLLHNLCIWIYCIYVLKWPEKALDFVNKRRDPSSPLQSAATISAHHYMSEQSDLHLVSAQRVLFSLDTYTYYQICVWDLQSYFGPCSRASRDVKVLLKWKLNWNFPLLSPVQSYRITHTSFTAKNKNNISRVTFFLSLQNKS